MTKSIEIKEENIMELNKYIDQRKPAIPLHFQKM